MLFETETKKLNISKELKRKVEMICKFANIKDYTFKQGIIVGYKGTNIGFVKPHILTIDKDDYLILENHNYVYINGYIERIPMNKLQEYIKDKY